VRKVKGLFGDGVCFLTELSDLVNRIPVDATTCHGFSNGRIHGTVNWSMCRFGRGALPLCYKRLISGGDKVHLVYIPTR